MGNIVLVLLCLYFGGTVLKAAAIAFYCRINTLPVLHYLPQALNPLSGKFVDERLISGSSGPEGAAGVLVILIVYAVQFLSTYFSALAMYHYPFVRKSRARVLGPGALLSGMVVSVALLIILEITHFQWDYFTFIYQESSPFILPFVICIFCLAAVLTAFVSLVVNRRFPGDIVDPSVSPESRGRWGPLRMVLTILVAGLVFRSAIMFSTQSSIDTEVLMTYCAKGDVVRLGKLIKKSSDINKQTHHGLRPLQMACLAADPETVKFLLERGAEPGTPDFFDLTPLQAACLGGNPETVKLILATGIKPDAMAVTRVVQQMRLGIGGDSPFSYALISGKNIPREQEKQKEMIEILLKCGAPLESDDENISPLTAAAEAGNPNIVGFLLDHGAKINFADSRGETALMHAAAEAREDVVRLLLDRGADLNLAAKNHATALYYAVTGRWARPEKDVEKRLAIVRLFISKGAEVNVKVSLGIVDKSELFNTALSKVLPLGHDMVMLLLENGADPGLEKYGVQTLRNAALKNDWRDVLDLLDQKGFKDP